MLIKELEKRQIRLRVDFVDEYTEKTWRKFYKYTIKKELDQYEIWILLKKRMTWRAVRYWYKRVKTIWGTKCF